MPNDQLAKIFLQAAGEVLETMCFVGVIGETPETAGGRLISAELTFRGNPSGRFGVQMSPETGNLVASNFLGKDAEDIAAADVEQVLGELANMICGSVLSRLEAGARFELQHPAVVPRTKGTPHSEAVQYTLELEEGSMILWMDLADPAPACSAA